MKQITDRLGQITLINYDDTNGLTRTITDRRGNQRAEVYDQLGRPTSVAQGGEPPAPYQYDSNGKRVGITDGLGNQTNYTYDAFNRVTSVIHGVTPQTPGGLQTEAFGYDSNGNVTSYNDGVNGVSRVFDELNRLISSTDGEGNTTGFQYDGRGLMTAKTFASASCISVNAVESFVSDERVKALSTLNEILHTFIVEVYHESLGE